MLLAAICCNCVKWVFRLQLSLVMILQARICSSTVRHLLARQQWLLKHDLSSLHDKSFLKALPMSDGITNELHYTRATS